MDEFAEAQRIWMDYDDVHADASLLFQEIQRVTPGPAVLIAMARGGWLPTRLLASNYEKAGIPTRCLDIGVVYRDVGTPNEAPAVEAALDDYGIRLLVDLVRKGWSPWLIDGPYLMGRSAAVAVDYVTRVLGEESRDAELVRIGVLHWVVFKASPAAPWRHPAPHPPHAYARRFDQAIKPYVEYPWEYPDLEAYRQMMQADLP